MHGDEVLGRLKADPGTAHIPVVIVTSHDVDAGLRERLGGRAHAILHKKDLSMETLERTLDAIGRAPA
jgi:CheY-like chemotaxis protein